MEKIFLSIPCCLFIVGCQGRQKASPASKVSNTQFEKVFRVKLPVGAKIVEYSSDSNGRDNAWHAEVNLSDSEAKALLGQPTLDTAVWEKDEATAVETRRKNEPIEGIVSTRSARIPLDGVWAMTVTLDDNTGPDSTFYFYAFKA